MAVEFDNDDFNSASGQNSVTIPSFVVANNSDRYLIVAVGTWDPTSGDTVVTGVTFNGSATGWGLIQSEQGPISAGSNNRVTLWGLKNPAATTGDIIVEFPGTCEEICAYAMSAYNVDQTTPLGTPATAEGDEAFPSVDVGAATGDLVIDAVFGNHSLSSTPTAGAGQTSRLVSHPIPDTTNSFLAVSTQPGETTTTMSWSNTGSNALHYAEQVQLAVALKVASGGSPITDGPKLTFVRSNIRMN